MQNRPLNLFLLKAGRAWVEIKLLKTGKLTKMEGKNIWLDWYLIFATLVENWAINLCIAKN